MKIALIADTFPPLCTSGAVQLRDLSREFIRQGHSLTVLLPSADIEQAWKLEEVDGARVLRLRAPKTKDIGSIRRTCSEFLMPFFMRRNFAKSSLRREFWDGVVWYSPSIFHGPLVRSIKRVSTRRAYLIIRDIFPEWALDMGLIKPGLRYQFFAAVARFQYSVADIIGVQTQGNLHYFSEWRQRPGRALEVLQNWLDRPAQVPCRIRLSETRLAGRRVLVYTGNMGVAQGMDILLELATNLQVRDDIGFLFVGRGSDARRLREVAAARSLSNVLFFDEIPPDELPDLYQQCSIGLVALDPRHKSHNIPGKFLSYVQNGLPVLANVNAGNDLATMIRNERVGQVCESNCVDEMKRLSEMLLHQLEEDAALPNRCRSLFAREFSVEKTVRQIVAALSSTSQETQTQ